MSNFYNFRKNRNPKFVAVFKFQGRYLFNLKKVLPKAKYNADGIHEVKRSG